MEKLILFQRRVKNWIWIPLGKFESYTNKFISIFLWLVDESILWRLLKILTADVRYAKMMRPEITHKDVPPHLGNIQITDEWRLMSLVIDRICLLVYFILNMIAISLFILQASSLFDSRQPLQRTIAQKLLSDAVSMLGIWNRCNAKGSIWILYDINKKFSSFI